MPVNYVLIRKVTVGAGVATVTLDNIPQTGYTDLKISASVRTNVAGGGPNDWLTMSFNGSSSSFTFREMESNATTSGAYSGSAAFSVAGTTAGQTANTFASGDIYIPNYTGSKQKAYSVDTVTENNATSSLVSFLAGTWANTSAITSITFGMNTGTLFSQHSTFSLYGIAAVDVTPTAAPFATGGDIVANDGTYWYHAFLSSGQFIPTKALSADCLVVAGGGAGGWAGGGGGAGGLRHFASQSLAAGINQTVIVGAGGAGSVTLRKNGTNGSNSFFGSLTPISLGGGGGAGYEISNGFNGGSGGGGNNINGSTTIGSGGTGTSGQGNNGGSSGNTNNTGYGTGGGGGAGAVGGNGTNSAGGNGGAGVNTYSSYASATGTGANSGYYAGGGGGGVLSSSYTAGTGGLGGGGAGRNSSGVAPSGTANTGGGGGAGFNGSGTVDGGAGGSGIVIIRYPMV
jgi:hypothetical protein